MSQFPDFDRSGLAIDVVADGEFLPRPHAGHDRSHIGFVLAGQGLEQAPPLEKLKPVQLEAHILGECQRRDKNGPGTGLKWGQLV